MGEYMKTYRFIPEQVKAWLKQLQADDAIQLEQEAKLKEKCLKARLGIR
jgi:hypothetical protein